MGLAWFLQRGNAGSLVPALCRNPRWRQNALNGHHNQEATRQRHSQSAAISSVVIVEYDRRMRRLFFLVACLHAKVAAAELVALRYVEAAERPYQPTNLSLETADTKIICIERGAKIGCQLEARYTLQNYTEEAETVVLALFTPGYTHHLTLSEGQENLLRDLTDAEQEAFRRQIPRQSLVSFFERPSGAKRPEGGASLRVGPGQRREVVFRGQLLPQNPYLFSSLDEPKKTPALLARHLALSNEWDDEFLFHMSFEDLNCWPVVGGVSLVIQVPARWKLGYDSEMPAFETREAQGTQTLIFGTNSNPKTNFSLSFYAKAPWLQGGGLLLGLGGSFGAESSFLFRAGYEAGNSRGLLASLSAETNFHSRVALIPHVGLGTPWLEKFPSFGFLLGAPLLVEQGQSFAAGFRMQLDLTYGAIGLSMPFDIYPSRPLEARLQTAILAHFSF